MPKHNNQIHNQNEEKEKRASELSTIIQNLKRKEEHLQTEVTEHKRTVEALRLSEQKFFILFEKSAFTASLSRLPDGVITNVNEAFERAFGYTKQEAIGKTSLELGINPDEESRARILATLKEHGSVRNQELALHTKSGEMRIFSVNVDLMDIGDQKYILNTTQDITERKQAEEMLCQNEERFSSAFEYSSIGMSLVAEDGRFLKVNNALRDIVGYSDQELLAKTFQDITHPDDMDADLAHLHQLVVGEILTYKIEKRYFHKSGQVVWVLLNVSMIHDAQGKPPYFISQIQDITERKQAEIDIRKKSEQLHLLSTELEIILDNIPALVFYKDTNNRFIRVNKYMSDAYKMSKKQLEGASLFDLHSSGQAQAYYDDDLQVIRSRQPKLNIDEPWEIENGTRWINTSKIPYIDETGEVVGVIVVSMDITERKQAEEELVLANQELFFQNEEKENRAAELVLANQELAFQNDEKEKRAAELIIANQELLFQNEEKEKRAAELVIANKELVFQNEEKEKRAAELIIANKELAFQNDEKEKRASELVQANEEIACRLQNIQALYKIDQAIVGDLDLNQTLHVVLEQTRNELNVNAAAILLFNPHNQILEFAAGIGFRSKAIERSRLRLGEGLGGRAALEERTTSVTNLLVNSAQFTRFSLLAGEEFVTYFSTPLIAKGQVKGVLEVFHRSPLTPDHHWLDFLEVLAGQSAISVDNASLLTSLQRSNRELVNAYDSTIEGWSHALDLRDKETEGHSLRVTEMTMKLGHMAGVSEADIVHLRRGALLHDIGKMGVPDHILLKPDKLTDEEWVAMRKHPVFAFELLSPIAFLGPALDIPYCHHEKWDGSGYPRGLKGDQIPLAARLFAIVDVWDALRSDRPYRQGWAEEKVIEHIKSLSGTHFDPKVVELFLTMMNEYKKTAG